MSIENKKVVIQHGEFRRKQLEILFQTSFISIFTHLIFGLAWSAILWGKTNSEHIIFWYLFLTIIMIYRFACLKVFQHYPKFFSNYEIWYKIYLIGIFFSGLIWGLSGLLTPEIHKDFFQIICALVVSLILAGSVTTLYASIEASVLYMLSAILPHFYYITKINNQTAEILIPAFIFGFIFLVTAFKRMNNTFIYKLELEIENEKLIKELKKEKDIIKKVNIDLEYEAAEKEEKYLKSFKASPDAISITRLSDNKFIEVNPKFADLSGYQLHEIIGNSAMEINLWADSADRKNLISKLKKNNGSIANFDSLFRKKDGEIRNCLISAEIIDINNEKHILSVAKDITETKQLKNQLIDSEEKFSTAFLSFPEPITISTLDGILVEVNESCIQTSGYSRKELIGKSVYDVGVWSDTTQRESLFKSLKKYGFVKNLEADFDKKDGGISHCIITASIINLNNTPHILIITRDITEQRKAQRLLLESEERFKNAFSMAPIGIALVDKTGTIFHSNPKCFDVIGYKPDELVGKTIKDITHPDDLESGISYFKKLMHDQIEHYQLEKRYKHKDGHYVWCKINASSLKNSNEEILYAIVHVEDITEARKTTEQLSYQASHDMLTGLINRREFESRLKHSIDIARTENRESVLCFLDLDQFKLVNDACGHLTGDEFLCQLAYTLQSSIHDSDTLARLGGDEFAILMDNCDLEHGMKTAEKIRSEIEKFKFFWEEKYFSVGVSIGLVMINKESQNLIDLLKQADTACYTAKDMGRNRIHVYRENDLALAVRKGEMSWAQKLSDALIDDQFILYAQEIIPVVRSSKDNVKSYEILLRLINPDGEPISPNEFIVAADRYNLNLKIDNWVINKFMSWLEKNKDYFDDRPTNFSINLTGSSINSHEIKKLIIQYLESSYIIPERITFEITETAAIENFKEANIFMSDLKKYGCKFSLDDFGSGLSSFAYLKNLPTDILKIDGVFVKDMDINKNDYAMVKIINEIGHSMGMKTVAEFVENKEIYNNLKKIGVDYAQGYLNGKAEPIESIFKNS
jgi:diguanylate cyclase (GGDEF)-like protein/PAS domain S-box-containing protein